MLYSLIEKAFMVFWVTSNVDSSFTEGFYAPAVMDGVIVVWSVLYFMSLRNE